MDAGACREHLNKLIDAETGELAVLGELLEQEHGLLENGDLPALDAAMRERQRCIGRILRVDEERRLLCRNLSHSEDAAGLARLMSWCDPSGTLARRWSQCMQAAARCRILNDRNGALVSARLQHVQQRLSALVNAGRQNVTYRRDGAYSVATVGRVVTTEA
jgi:flagellar biosynthesis/type III secretory pathway chaperone